MKLTQFLQKNLLWNLDRNPFGHLCCAPTTEDQLVQQLYKLSDSYFPQQKKVEVTYTEFCLNQIALSVAKTDAQKCVKQHFESYWQRFVRLKSVFQKDFMLLPSDGGRTRLERIAELVTRCTQFAVDDATLARICEKIRSVFDLEEREDRNLENAVALYEVNFFCAVAKGVFCGEAADEARLAKALDEERLNIEFCHNSNLRHAYYSTKRLVANVDCLANSATKFVSPTAIDVKPYFYVNGKNVFDTFCFSKFGKKTAQFYSQSATLKVSMQYFLDGCREVRRYAVENLGKGNKKIVTDFLLRHMNPGAKTTFFDANGALCIAVEGDKEFYCALAIVADNKVLACPFEEGRLSATVTVLDGGRVNFDLVTVFAENMPDLSDELQNLGVFGSTRCPYLVDAASDNVVNFKNPLRPTTHGYVKRDTPPKEAATLNFTYQLGNDSVATFLDNAGNCTTLMNGFVFGVQGERVYAVKNGAMAQLNKDKFTLQNDSVTYSKPNGAVCTLLHTDKKTYKVSYPTPHKTLFYFPLEEKCKVSFQNNAFAVSGQLRNFVVTCRGKVESYTTNALECNSERLRYKLSCETTCGSCLAICFASDTDVQLDVASVKKIALPTPLVRESLVSTYLNYVNAKNVFCLNNFLKRADSLTVAAINFTNPQFVKSYLQEVFDKNVFYYDVTGRRKKYYDRLALPLAAVYYQSLTDDESFPTEQMKKYVSGVIFSETFTGRDLCVKALVLKKAAQLKGYDKVRCLIEYNNVKKIVTADAKLYGYAQAIGAVSLTHPSKQRLKDLCNKLEIPKSWYYVSQLENLYGLSLVGGALHFAPKVAQENVLEQLALDVYGKRIDTTFTKSTVQSMTLNGTQYFVPFKPQSLKNQNNTLVVRY